MRGPASAVKHVSIAIGALPEMCCNLIATCASRRDPATNCIRKQWCFIAAGYVTKCLLSPDMQKLATVSSDKTIKLWNIDGFTLDRTLTGMSRACADDSSVLKQGCMPG